MALEVQFYDGNAAEWDEFILNRSMNGTFMQTRKFIAYHQERLFEDCSLCIRKGRELVGAIFGCRWEEDGQKWFFGHKGSTYGGITVSETLYSATRVDEMFRLTEDFLREHGFQRIYLRMVPMVYQKKNTDLLDYFLYQRGYTCYSELNYYLELEKYREDVVSRFSSGKRRDYRYALKNGLVFRRLMTKEEIAEFYAVLEKNHAKLGVPTIHSLAELWDLALERYPEGVRMYGVYLGDRMLAGSTIYVFGENVWHTQYLASDEDYLHLFPMDYLIKNLIQEAVDAGMERFTFGICTEDQGRYLNLGLSRFKEGFGSVFCINRSYEKAL